MKKLIILIALLTTGCNTADTPEKALLSVGKAITQNKLGDLKDYLAWQAKTDYGSKAGIAKLRSRANGQKIELGTVLSMGTPVYQHDQVYRYYAGSLYAGGREYIDAEVICVSEDMTGEHSTSPSTVMVTYCFVSKVYLK